MSGRKNLDSLFDKLSNLDIKKEAETNLEEFVSAMTKHLKDLDEVRQDKINLIDIAQGYLNDLRNHRDHKEGDVETDEEIENFISNDSELSIVQGEDGFGLAGSEEFGGGR